MDPSETEAFLDDRYGRTSRPTWRFPLIAAVLLILATAWTLWAAYAQVDQSISAQIYGYDVIDDHHIELVLEVRRSEGGAGLCTVEARGADHSIVGEREVTVPDSAHEMVHVSTTVVTERRAVTGTITGCFLRP